MPFEPRIFGEWPAGDGDKLRPDRFALRARFSAPSPQPPDATADATNEDHWPDDLAELAQQLGDEARLLGEKYPASAAACEMESARAAAMRQPGRFARLRFAAAAAAVVVGLSMAVEIAYRAGGNGGDPGSPVGPAVVAQTGNDDVSPLAAGDSVQGAVVPVSLPAAVFSNLSGAEQEGVLDLMKDVRLRVEI